MGCRITWMQPVIREVASYDSWRMVCPTIPQQPRPDALETLRCTKVQGWKRCFICTDDLDCADRPLPLPPDVQPAADP
jgi:hypothetical protein